MSTQRGRVLEIGIFHKELIGEDKFVASVTVPVADFIELPEGKLDLWVGCKYFYFVGCALLLSIPFTRRTFPHEGPLQLVRWRPAAHLPTV